MPHMFFTLAGEYLNACESDGGTFGRELAFTRQTPVIIASVTDDDMMQLWQISPTGRIANATPTVGKAVIDTINEMQRAGEGG